MKKLKVGDIFFLKSSDISYSKSRHFGIITKIKNGSYSLFWVRLAESRKFSATICASSLERWEREGRLKVVIRG
jgi:hypothetical protein